eukprot:gene792-13935_t
MRDATRRDAMPGCRDGRWGAEAAVRRSVSRDRLTALRPPPLFDAAPTHAAPGICRTVWEWTGDGRRTRGAEAGTETCPAKEPNH